MMLDSNHGHRKRPSLASSTNRHVIGVGSRVSLRDLASGELDIYTLVLPVDADITRHCISTFTPLGHAIVGRKAGEVVEFVAPGGLMKLRIESVTQAPLVDLTGRIP
jgi:transcription elongation GreA/GreB family factor